MGLADPKGIARPKLLKFLLISPELLLKLNIYHQSPVV